MELEELSMKQRAWHVAGGYAGSVLPMCKHEWCRMHIVLRNACDNHDTNNGP